MKIGLYQELCMKIGPTKRQRCYGSQSPKEYHGIMVFGDKRLVCYPPV